MLQLNCKVNAGDVQEGARVPGGAYIVASAAAMTRFCSRQSCKTLRQCSANVAAQSATCMPLTHRTVWGCLLVLLLLLKLLHQLLFSRKTQLL